MKEFLRNITPLQWLGIIILFNGTVVGGTTALLQMGIPHGIVQGISAFCGLANVFLGGLVTMFGGQGAMVKSVAAMPGVESIAVNKQANATLAQIAVSLTPDASKIEAIPTDASKVAETAKSGG